MTDAASRNPLTVKTAADVDRLLGRWDKLQQEIVLAESQRDGMINLLRGQTAEYTDPRLQEQRAILDAVGRYLQSRRSSWIRRFGRTATLENGVVKWRIIGASLITPKNTKRIIEELLKLRGGKKYLRMKPELDRDALKNAPPGLLRRLRPFGVRVGRQETLSVVIKDHDPIVLRQNPYPHTKP